MRDACLDEGAHPMGNSQLIDEYHAARLTEGERPGRSASAEPERPRRPGREPKLARLVFCPGSRSRGKHRVPATVIRCSMSGLGRASSERNRENSSDCGNASRHAPPGTG
jgi:hypothetical protein